MSTSPVGGTGQPIRLGNFYSSFDTQAVVRALADAASAPIVQMQRKQDVLKQKSAAIARLQTELAALLSDSKRLLQADSVSGKSATVTGPGVSATPSTATPPGTTTVSVVQIATGTTVSGGSLSATLDATSALNASNVGLAVIAGTFTIKTSLGGATFTVDPATQSLNDVIAAINAQASATGVTASLQADATGGLNLLNLQSSAGAILLGNGADTSNFLAATNLLASPGTATRTSTLGVNRINPTASLASARLSAGALATGPHTLTINGVQVAYDAQVDSLSSVLSRINQSAAGVRATYDTVSDRLTLTQSRPGSIGIQLAEDATGGDFLTRTGLLNATQSPGQNAQYSINGGPLLHSPSNTVQTADGLTLTLTAPTGPVPATVTVAQDSASAVSAIGTFVDDYNALLADLAAVTKSDKSAPGILSGDSNLVAIEARLRGLMSRPGNNISGRYSQLASVGLSFGPIGSAPGATKALVFDRTVFAAAQQADPLAVQNALSQLTLTAALEPGGTTSVTGMTGSYTGTAAGRYVLNDDGAGTLTATLSPADGSASTTSSATITAGSTNSALIPGVTLNIGVLTAGTAAVTATASSESVIGMLYEVLNGLAGPSGTFKNLRDEYTNVIRSLEESKARTQASVDARVAVWQRKFAAMERAQAAAQATLATLNTQLNLQKSAK